MFFLHPVILLASLEVGLIAAAGLAFFGPRGGGRRRIVSRSVLGLLLGLTLTPSAFYAFRQRDRLDRPFRPDPAVLGEWETVDFVAAPEYFTPGQRSWGGPMYWKKAIFEAQGLVRGEYGENRAVGVSPWTQGWIICRADRTASQYRIRQLEGTDYLFCEWKSGDYVYIHQRPYYYVLKRTGPPSPQG